MAPTVTLVAVATSAARDHRSESVHRASSAASAGTSTAGRPPAGSARSRRHQVRAEPLQSPTTTGAPRAGIERRLMRRGPTASRRLSLTIDHPPAQATSSPPNTATVSAPTAYNSTPKKLLADLVAHRHSG